MRAQVLDFYRLAVFGLVRVIELQVDYGKGVLVFLFILERKLLTANACIRLFKLYQIQRIVQINFEQLKIGVAFAFGYFIPDATAVFLLLPINIRRFNGNNSVCFSHNYLVLLLSVLIIS